MNRESDHVLQIKITIDGIKPPIWRRIQVPWRYTFWDLHVAIQNAMGWQDDHLHEFILKSPFVERVVAAGIVPDEEPDAFRPTFPAWTVPVARFLTLERRRVSYVYDFQDKWRHTVLLEKILPSEKGVVYPRCLGGRRACPPEETGGPAAFEGLLAAFADPECDGHEESLEWVGASYDPAAFDKHELRFEDPREHFQAVFGEPLDERKDPVPRVSLEEGEKVPVTLTLEQRELLLECFLAAPAVIAPLRLCAIAGDQATAKMSLDQITSLMAKIGSVVRDRRRPRVLQLLVVGRALRRVFERYVEYR